MKISFKNFLYIKMQSGFQSNLPYAYGQYNGQPLDFRTMAQTMPQEVVQICMNMDIPTLEAFIKSAPYIRDLCTEVLHIKIAQAQSLGLPY